MKESIDEKSSVSCLKANADCSWPLSALQLSKQWNKFLYLFDDQHALVTLQLSAFCDTTYHVAFAIKTSIKPFH